MVSDSRFVNYSPSSEKNKEFILNELGQLFREPGLVLEIGSGSGQHAIHFASSLKHLKWQPSDQGHYLPGLKQNISNHSGSNVLEAIELDVASENWPQEKVDYVFCANAIHIMSEAHVVQLVAGVGRTLAAGGIFVLYGPFKYKNEFTTASNAGFDQWLKDRDSLSGIRDIEWVQQLVVDNEMSFLSDRVMPANNQLLAFGKRL